MIPKAFIQTLLDRTDIVRVIEHSIPLKKAGQNYVACCPFHQEKSPSFSVSPVKQFYHCFGCGVHGNALSFLMEYQGLSFVDAVESLAAEMGLTVPHEDTTLPKAHFEKKEHTQELVEVMNQAVQFYRASLKKSPSAIAYFKNRGVQGTTAAYFGLGFAPETWQPLERVFQDYASNPLLIETGLVIEKEGKRYDRFRDRILFPIRNQKGQFIGLGGRAIEANQTPKYLNSPETPLFSKGKELYGLFEAKHAIREWGYVIVVEGYMDVVMLAQEGIRPVVATLGTATTEDHLRTLFRHTSRLFFAFDGDTAGQKAAWKAVQVALPLLQEGQHIQFLFFPPEHDPDSFIRAVGREGFLSALNEAEPLSRFILNHLARAHPLGLPEGRASALKEAQFLLNTLKAPAFKLILSKECARLIGVEESALWPVPASAPSSQYRPQSTHKTPAKRWKKAHQPPSLARTILMNLLQMPTLADTLDWPEKLYPFDEETQCLKAVLDLFHLSPVSTTGSALHVIEHLPYRDYLHELFQQSDNLSASLSEAEIRLEMEAAFAQLEAQGRQLTLEALKQKDRQGGLSEAEKQWFLELLMLKA